MKSVLFWFGMMVGMILTLAFSDQQGANGHKPRVHGFGKATLPLPGKDWLVRLHLTDLSETDACDYEHLLVEKFSDEFDQGRAYILVQKGEIHEPGL